MNFCFYHPLNWDIPTRKNQWEEFMVTKFLSGLRFQPSTCSWSPFFSPYLMLYLVSSVFFTGASGSSVAPACDASILLSRGTSRGPGRGCDFRNSRHCDYCGRTNHFSTKCWIKFTKLDWPSSTTSTSVPTPLTSLVGCGNTKMWRIWKVVEQSSCSSCSTFC